MSTYTRSTYNVYENGILVATKQRSRDVAKIAGCDYGLVNQYAKDNSKFHGTYTFKIAETVEHETKPRGPKLRQRVNSLWMPQEWIDDWNENIYRHKRAIR